MAHVFPPEIQSGPVSGGEKAELTTLLQLKESLSDDYTVFHSVHWTLSAPHRTQFGEIDFIVVNQDGRALLIEQKMGDLEETTSGLVKRYGTDQKSVVHQMHRSLDSIRNKWSRMNDARTRLDIDLLLYCPGYRVRDLNAAGIASSRIVDAQRADKLADVIENLLGRGDEAATGHQSKVEDFFAQAFDLVPDVSSFVGAQRKVFTRLTEGLTRVVRGLDFSPFRLRVVATAGSGKSQLGRQVVARAIGREQRALFLCFNRPLAERIAQAVGNQADVNTYHGFCTDFLKSIGEAVDFSTADSDPLFWQNLQDQVMAAAIGEAQQYDCLVVDEGQDFEQAWWEILRLFLRPGAEVVWLEDPEQNIYNKEPVVLDGFVSYTDKRNYRTPVSIANFIREYLGSEFDCINTLPGMGARVTECRAEDDPTALLNGCIKILKRRGFKNDDIVILSCKGVGKSFLGDADSTGSVKLKRWTGEYDQNNFQVLTDGDILFETVYRFKGQQAPAIILIDALPAEQADERMQRVMFCGMTRATVRLEVMVRSV